MRGIPFYTRVYGFPTSSRTTTMHHRQHIFPPADAANGPATPMNTGEGQRRPTLQRRPPNVGWHGREGNPREVYVMEDSSQPAAKEMAGAPVVESTCVIEMVNARTAAAIVGVSRRSWWRFVAQGLAPKPIRLGRCVRWRLLEIQAWIRAGCSS
jgi:predicted DNA-binding transcriptional regulator AlpA